MRMKREEHALTEATIGSTVDEATTIPAPSVLAPIVPTERIDLMDVLRGFALIGILLMNVEWFNRPIAELLRLDTTLTGVDHAVAWTVKIFVEGKFYKLFSLLFGMGFAVMLTRAEAKGLPFTAMFLRRMGALFLFGVLHMVLLWNGDILHDYAVGGLLLLGWVALFRWRRLRRFNTDRFLRRFSLIAIALPLVVGSVVGFGYGLTHDPSEARGAWQERQQTEPRVEAMLAEAKAGKRDLTAEPKTKEKVDLDKLSVARRIEKRAETQARRRAQHDKEVAEEIKTFKQPSYGVATRYRAEQTLRRLARTPFFALFILLPIFLFGFWLIRSGVVSDPEPHLPGFRIVALVGLLFGFIFSVGAYTIIHHPVTQLVNAFSAIGFMMTLLGQLLMTAGYVAFFVLVMHRARWRERLRWLAPMGRMALTNYLMHSLILTTLFYGYGFAQFGRISRAPQMLLVVAIIAFQALFSRWWLSRFQYGPLEWLWRSITYWQWQRLRLPAPSAEPVAQ
jgi:uncharacterized protein